MYYEDCHLQVFHMVIVLNVHNILKGGEFLVEEILAKEIEEQEEVVEQPSEPDTKEPEVEVDNEVEEMEEDEVPEEDETTGDSKEEDDDVEDVDSDSEDETADDTESEDDDDSDKTE